ncbi:aKG-HExxH-type peptide beta-hydroxylase [Pacificoceanicola onchidii]|uniref:aKG-HExxH-type peptide beta-hydroxylase n=1 Tax=Pacificoceanicola onchidii TaxID=2562685 RepID=UPI0010A36516|nr:HEXXH motif-containing putative peptide modification protein [Pacificoceanicola onchidii]
MTVSDAAGDDPALEQGSRWAFEPSAARAKALDAWMHQALLDSFLHISERCASKAPGVTEALAQPIAHLRACGILPPEAFGTYYELVEHASGGDIDQAVENAREIAACCALGATEDWPVFAVGAENAAQLERAFKRRMSPGERGLFDAVDEDSRATFSARLRQGLDLLKRGAPDIHIEIRSIIRSVLLAQAPEGSKLEFDGASHYELWGLVLLNPKFHETPLAVAEVLAHECGHSLLFGMMGKELLVHNPYEDRYPSPLRPDPRPMDGIFHATFVSARMAMTMEQLAASGILTPAERADALEAAARDRANFASGDSVIRSDGRLTETGAAIIENARRWIALPPVTAGG